MQFFWKYVDDLMGKGLSIGVILELLFYVSATLIPLALPLAILLSSIMTFGNLAENNELTALKSSGLSLYKIIRPHFYMVITICVLTFYFANFVIPVANLKWRALIYDIQETKIAKILTPGSYSTELTGFAIKVDSEKNGELENVVIHDHTSPNAIKTVKAKRGSLNNAINGPYLYLTLEDGIMFEELSVNQADNLALKENGNFFPSKRTEFEKTVYQIDMSGFKLNRSDENLFENSHEMLNVFQIQKVLDSITIEKNKASDVFVESIKSNSLFFTKNQFLASNFSDNQSNQDSIAKELNEDMHSKNVIETTIQKVKRFNESITGQIEFEKTFQTNADLYKIEFHRKYALTFAILILFFVGAPLGAIVKKGGFGAPVVIACLLFMVYFVLTEIGEGLVTSKTATPFIGMWLASFVLAPFAFLLMRSAANDSKFFDKDSWIKFFKRKTK
jgi:lipopolysaccharide export system permease protein